MSDKSEKPRANRRLRDCVNAIVIQQCDKIARTLVNQPAKGNITDARRLAQLGGAKPASRRQRPGKKQKGASWAQLLAVEKEMDEQEDLEVQRGGLTWEERNYLDTLWNRVRCTRHKVDKKNCDDPECPVHGKGFRTALPPWSHWGK
jgi:hypothetical protein